MSYRNDRDADQARIAALEDELARANARIAELEGKPTTALAIASTGELAIKNRRARRWLGAPTVLECSRQFDGELPHARFRELVEWIRAQFRDWGQLEVAPTTVVWRGTLARAGGLAKITLTAAVGGGITTLTMQCDSSGTMAGMMLAIVPLGTAVGAMIGMTLFAPAFALPPLAYAFARKLTAKTHLRVERVVGATYERVAGELQRLLAARGA